MEEDLPDNVIQFDRKKPKEPDPMLKIKLDRNSAQDMILVLACMNMNSDFKQECQTTFSVNNFPCQMNCSCYLHMLSAMAMEVIFDGPKAAEAHEAIMLEYLHSAEKVPKKETSEEDNKDND